MIVTIVNGGKLERLKDCLNKKKFLGTKIYD